MIPYNPNINLIYIYTNIYIKCGYREYVWLENKCLKSIKSMKAY